MKHLKAFDSALATLLLMLSATALTDEDFYGQLPPVYPSGE